MSLALTAAATTKASKDDLDPSAGPDLILHEIDEDLREPETPSPDPRTHLRVFNPADAVAKLVEVGADLSQPQTRGSDRNAATAMQERWWRRMAEDAAKGWRGRLIAGREQAQALDDLRPLLPGATNLLDLAGDALAASVNTGSAVRLPPVLLLGPPGVGKSYAADAIAKAMNAPIVAVSMPTQTGANVFAGTDALWRNPRIGLVAEALVMHDNASPIIFVDEIDKPFVLNGYERPLDALHTLLEPLTARAFKDELLEIAFDASQVVWIATANDLGPIPPAVVDRFMILEIKAPDPSRMAVMIRKMAADAFAAHPGWFEPMIADAVVARLAMLHPRRLRRVLELACTAAAAAGARQVTVEHVARAQGLIEQGLARPVFGFRG